MARRAPSARLYSRVPRSSAWPSMVIVYCGYWLSQRAWLRRMPVRLAGQGRAVLLEMHHVADIDGEFLCGSGSRRPFPTEAIFPWPGSDASRPPAQKQSRARLRACRRGQPHHSNALLVTPASQILGNRRREFLNDLLVPSKSGEWLGSLERAGCRNLGLKKEGMPETPPHHATASRHPCPVQRKSLGFRNSLSRSLDANNLLDHDWLTRASGARRTTAFSWWPKQPPSATVAATMVATMITPFKPCMVFSPLVKTAVAVFACTGAAFSDQYRTTVRGPFCRSLMPKCHSESHPPARRRYLPRRGRSSLVNRVKALD